MMNNKWTWVGSAIGVVAIAALIVVLWPRGDPLARVETIAVQPPDWDVPPQGKIIQDPFLNGLEIILGDKNINIVGNVDEADAVLVIKEIKVGTIEVVINEGGVEGNWSGWVCWITHFTILRSTLLQAFDSEWYTFDG